MSISKLWQEPSFTGYKILAVVLALLLWGYVTVTQNPLTEGTYNVPVELRNLSEDLAQPDTNYQVQVRVQATSAIINELTSKDIVAYVDLTDFNVGEAAPSILLEQLPDGVTLVSLSSDSIQLTLEAKVSKDFTLSVQITGEPAENFSLLDAVPSPEIVTISGTAEQLQNAAEAVVIADVSGLEESFSRNLSVEIRDAGGNNITEHFAISPSTASIVVPIVYTQPEASITVRAVTTGEPADGYRVSRVVVQPSTLRAFGDLEILDQLYYLETEPISISGLSQNASYTARVKSISNVTLPVDTVTVIVQIEPIRSKTVSHELLTMQNLPAGMNGHIAQQSTTVVVSGPDEDIDALDEAAVVPYVDCTNCLEPGVYDLPVSITLPANISLVSIDPVSVSVEITAIEQEITPEGVE